MQVTLRGAETTFAPAPSRDELEARGALFMTLPDDAYDDLFALCAARKAGLLDEEGAERLSELMRELSLLKLAESESGSQRGSQRGSPIGPILRPSCRPLPPA